MTTRSAARQATAPGILPLRVLYSAYAWVLFLVLALLALLLILVMPGLERRRGIARAFARAFLAAAGMPLRLHQVERLPPGQCVVVSNHASYLDGVVYKAALPPRFTFVIKREMSGVPIAGLFLRRIGSEFVDRFNRQRGSTDARRVLRNATNGHSLVFFPEGTFEPQPGLLKFHTGAFVTAVRAGCPVVPAVVHGTRTAFPGGTILMWPSPIDIELLPAIEVPQQRGDRAVTTMRDRARAAILARLGEPDRTAP
jgi:1-acyl-sn-glycerol-3-phosphate acyltransferase